MFNIYGRLFSDLHKIRDTFYVVNNTRVNEDGLLMHMHINC